MKAARALLILFLTALPAMGWTVNETALNDRASRTWTILGIDETTGEIRRIKTNAAGAMLTDSSAASIGAADQGISGVSDADPWNMMMRNSSGTELGLAASPFAISIFDAASNLLGVTANPFVVDLGLNNDVLIQATAVSPGSVRLSDGTVFYKGAEDRTLSTAPFSVRQTDGTSFFKAAEDRTTAGAPGSIQLSDGSAFYKAMDQATGDKIELNTDTAQTASEPVVIAVGTTPTLIFAASITRRLAFIQNSGTSTVFLGKAAVTTSTGEILAGSNVANDGKGRQAKAEHGDAIFGIVASGTVNVRASEVSD